MVLTTLLLSAAAMATAPDVNAVSWHDGPLSQAIGVAARSDKIVLVYFWRDGSDYCARFWQETLSSEDVQGALSEFVCYSASTDSGATTAMLQKYNVQTLPWIVILNSEGSADDALGGFVPHDEFLGELARIQRGEGTLTAMKIDTDKAKPQSDEHFEKRFVLAGKYQELGFQDEHDALVAGLRDDDPKGRTLPAGTAHMWDAGSQVRSSCTDNGGVCADGSDHDDECINHRVTDALVAFAKSTPHATLRHNAWSQIANLEAARNDVSEACKAFGKAWKDCAPEDALQWSHQAALYITGAEGEHKASDKKLALKFAEASLKLAKALDAHGEEDLGEYTKDDIVAIRMSTVALALELNGKHSKAKRMASNAVALAENEATTKVLAKLDA